MRSWKGKGSAMGQAGRDSQGVAVEMLERRLLLSLSILKDINSITGTSNPSEVVEAGGVYFFQATDPDHGAELWRSDGTEAGTYLVKDICPGTGSSSPGWMFEINDTLLFMANDGTSGMELWRSDGTAGGAYVVKDIYAGSNSGVTVSTDFATPVVAGGRSTSWPATGGRGASCG